MGVDTKAILRKDVSLEQIKETLETKYTNVKIISTTINYYFYIVFDDGESHRNLDVMFDDIAFHDYKINGVLLSLGCWGNSKEVVMLLLNKFGGYLDENDCDEIGMQPVNIELFEQAKELTAKDLFVNEIVNKLGYDRLKATLQLFEKYVDINFMNVIEDAYEAGSEDASSAFFNSEIRGSNDKEAQIEGLEKVTNRLLEKYKNIPNDTSDLVSWQKILKKIKTL